MFPPKIEKKGKKIELILHKYLVHPTSTVQSGRKLISGKNWAKWNWNGEQLIKSEGLMEMLQIRDA